MRTFSDTTGTLPPNQRLCYEISCAELPLHCPPAGSSLWNSHPRVFLPIDETGHVKCPYCGTEYVLVK